MYVPLGRPNKEGFYKSFATSPDYKGQFASTPEQQEFNATHSKCTECKGWGYRTLRTKLGPVRESSGCPNCLGLGVVERE